MTLRSMLFVPAALLAALAGCGSGDDSNQAAAPAADAVPTEDELARDAELANEAAADEAADMNNFGGSAAEMEQRNGF